MDSLCINEVKGWDIAARSNYAMQLNRLAFQNVQDVRNHQEEIQYNKSLTADKYLLQCLDWAALLRVQQ